MTNALANQLPIQLQEVYLNDACFNAIVHKHDHSTQDYTLMLEEAVLLLAIECGKQRDIHIEHCKRMGIFSIVFSDY